MEALETVIQVLKNAGLSTTQIASKKHYGDGWEVGSPAIVAALDGGDPDLYIPMQRVRIEVRCFAGSIYDAMKLASEVETVCRAIQRKTQAVTGGTALIYWINPASIKTPQFDADVKMDFALQFFEAAISNGSL